MDTIYNIVSILSFLASIIWAINGDAHLAALFGIMGFVTQMLSRMEE